MIELIYDPAAEQARVEYCSGIQWNSLGNTHVIIVPFSTGRIGVSGITGDMPDVWDDFGGGDWR